tara:strand:- start:1434 stop:1862 length:429 start_codon:yes stop_codon:yes gene_type:complete
MHLLRIWEEKEIDKVWIFVKDYIQKALDRSGGYADHEHIKDQIKNNLMQLWVAWSEEDQKVYAVGVTELKKYPKVKTMNFRILTGEKMNLWVKYLEPMEEWAKQQGVDKMEFYSRPGWEKFLKTKGYVKSHVQLDKFIGDKK